MSNDRHKHLAYKAAQVAESVSTLAGVNATRARVLTTIVRRSELARLSASGVIAVAAATGAAAGYILVYSRAPLYVAELRLLLDLALMVMVAAAAVAICAAWLDSEASWCVPQSEAELAALRVLSHYSAGLVNDAAREGEGSHGGW